MRSAAIVLIFFSHSALVQYAQCSEVHHLERSVLKHQLNIVHPHQILRRQASATGLPLDEYCLRHSVLNDAFCSSGAAQMLLDNDLRCRRSLEDARREYIQCAKSENGGFCKSLAFLNGALDYRLRNYTEGNCSDTFSSNICRTQCHTHLEDVKKNIWLLY